LNFERATLELQTSKSHQVKKIETNKQKKRGKEREGKKEGRKKRGRPRQPVEEKKRIRGSLIFWGRSFDRPEKQFRQPIWQLGIIPQ